MGTCTMGSGNVQTDTHARPGGVNGNRMGAQFVSATAVKGHWQVTRQKIQRILFLLEGHTINFIHSSMHYKLYTP